MEGNLYPRTNVEKKKHGIFQRCLLPLFRARCTLCLAKETRSCSNRKYAANTSTYVFGMLTVSLTQRMNKSQGIQPVWVGKRPKTPWFAALPSKVAIGQSGNGKAPD